MASWPTLGLQRRKWSGLLPNRKYHARVARFRQIDIDKPYVHHDAIELPDGQIVLVTSLSDGQTLTVLQLPADQTSDAEPRTQPQEEARPASEMALISFGF